MIRFRQRLLFSRIFRFYELHRREVIQQGKQGYRKSIYDLGLNPEELNLLETRIQENQEVLIADIDQDGRLKSYVGPIQGLPISDQVEFTARKRHDLQVVVVEGVICVRKDFRGNKDQFLNELRILHHLGKAGCNVPAIIDADFQEHILTISFIMGASLREVLAQHGAQLRDTELRKDPGYMKLSKKQREAMRIKQAIQVLQTNFDSQIIDQIFNELNKINSEGVIGNDIRYNNIIIEKDSRQPYWIDFEEPFFYPEWMKRCFAFIRDRDIEEFNQFFRGRKQVYRRIRKQISIYNSQTAKQQRAAMYFGKGLRIGSLFRRDGEYRCWKILLSPNLPSLRGKRLLNLGEMNAFLGLSMLRMGADELLHISEDNEDINDMGLIQSTFEWLTFDDMIESTCELIPWNYLN
jgi:tRNA A-37 threonylcarbamoyl transferase component Bud32